MCKRFVEIGTIGGIRKRNGKQEGRGQSFERWSGGAISAAGKPGRVFAFWLYTSR